MIPQFQNAIIKWYAAHKRDLPWRRTRDPYKIWVSEIMLQQTQVATVLPYYRRFIRTFPTPRHLAQAGEDEVLKLWEGLGYYARARNLHKACRAIVQKHGGHVPRSEKELAALPGVGPYTTGAILSIAFNQPAPIVDGNVTRVLCRIFGIRRDPAHPQVKRRLWRLARTLVPRQAPSDFNQGLMELGATVCTRSNPLCPQCPLNKLCTARRLGIEDKIPLALSRAPVKSAQAAVALIQKNGNVLVRRRPAHGFWGGLWEFPQLDAAPRDPKVLEKSFHNMLGAKIRLGKPLLTLKHRFTHLELDITVYKGTLSFTQPGKREINSARWVRTKDLGRLLPLSRAHQKIAQALTAPAGKL